MPKKIGDYPVPFDKSGSLLHFTYSQPGETGGRYGDWAAEWRENKPFTCKLTLDSMRSGRSAKYVIWQDDEGHSYPMFITDLLTLLQERSVVNGVTYDNTWIVRKRGKNYGLALVVDEEAT